MFKKLVLNDRFKKEFANRYADIVNFHFNKDTMRNSIISHNAEVQSEIADECARWPTNNPATWDYRYQNMLTCMDTRNITGLDQVDAGLLGNGGKATVTLQSQPLTGGKIQFSTIRPNLPWTGTYFKNNEVPFSAVPNVGYEFSHWITNNGIIRPEDLNKMALDTFFSSNTTLTAVFTMVNVTLSNKLLSFTTTAKECNVTGAWEMDTDEEIVSYEVQKKSSFDKDFRTVSKTMAKQVTQPVDYTFTDVATGNFEQYRLKITDLQGKVSYSNIAVARTNCTNFAAQIQTNPVVNEMVLNISNKNTAKQSAVVNIYNTNGAIVATTKTSISGNGTITMPVNTLSGGMYAVRVTVGNESAVLRFLKK
jgi:Secretion system C-terminal sorting domain